MLLNKPNYFDAELAEVHTHKGKPFFRCVDGRKATVFRNGNPRDIKYWDLVNGRRAGRNCWVIESYQSPSDISEDAWAATRYREMDVFGAPKMVDVLGPYPKEGRYVHFKDLRDANKSPTALTRSVIYDLKKTVAEFYKQAKLTEEEELAQSEINAEEWERARTKQQAQNFYDAHGAAALKMFHNVATNVSPRAPEPSEKQRRIWLPGDK